MLQQRLADLDSQRATTKQEIAVCQLQIVATVPPAPGTSTRIRVLWVMRQFDDRALSPIEICYKLGMLHPSDQTNVRLLMTRLLRERKVTKISHGRYQINPGV